MPLDPKFTDEGGDRDRYNDVKRVVPIQCTYAEYRDHIDQGTNFAGELLTTSDTHRHYKGAKFLGPIVYHGTIADEAAMLDLFNTSDRKCERGDWCHLTSRAGARMTCIAGNGLTLDDWKQDGVAEAAASTSYVPMANGSTTSPGFIFNSRGEPILVRVSDTDF